MRGLAGKTYIVTGGGSGVGRATAHRLAQFGAQVLVADIAVDSAHETASAIVDAGGIAHAHAADVTNERDVEAMVRAAVEAYGRLDGACNAAGIPQRGKPTHELSAAEWDRCQNVNLRGLFLCNKYEILTILESGGGGAIVNIASTLSAVAVVNSAEYSASKAGVLGLVRGAALDYAANGIRVNAILPGLIDTPMLQTALSGDPNLEAALWAVCPMKRISKPEEQAAAACFLLSDEASFITGAALPVDGGMLAL